MADETQDSRVQDKEAFLRRMGDLYDQMMARVGAQGETFDDIEELALRLGRQASQELMAQRLDGEEQCQPQAGVCTRCGGSLRHTREPKERNLETCAGVVQYQRRHAYCDRCRASFSPSGPAPDDPAAGGFQPAGPQDM